MAQLECKNCCYFDFSEGNPHEHCCFREWGHSDEEVAPCDEPDYDEYPSYEEDYDPAFYDECPDVDEV